MAGRGNHARKKCFKSTFSGILVPQPGIKPRPLAIRVTVLIIGTTREFPESSFRQREISYSRGREVFCLFLFWLGGEFILKISFLDKFTLLIRAALSNRIFCEDGHILYLQCPIW